MSRLLIRNLDDLSGLLVERFYLKLKEAVSSELSENWKVGVNFIIDDMISDVESDDSPDLAREQIWMQFLLDGVCRRMEVPEEWLEDNLTLREFEWLVVDVFKEWQQKSSTVKARVRPVSPGDLPVDSTLAQLEGLSLLLIIQFYLQLKEAVSSELVENWQGKWTFDIDEIRDEDDEDDEIEEIEEGESVSQPDWCEFLGVMRRRMKVSDAPLEDYPLAFIKFEFLVRDAIEELQQESSPVSEP
jgi:hypothetical protein